MFILLSRENIVTLANKTCSRDIIYACNRKRDKGFCYCQSGRNVEGKGVMPICEHYACAHKSRYMKTQTLLFMQRTNLRPSDDGQKLNISMVVQRAFRVTMKAHEWKKRRVKVNLFERKCARYRVTLAILLATSRLRASQIFRNDPGLCYSASIHINDKNIFSLSK